KDAGRLWRRLAGEEKYRRDLRLRLVLFDLALQEGQAGEMAAVLKEIRALEGGQGTFGRHAEALALIWAVKNGKAEGGARQKALDDAARLLEQVRAARPSWPAPLLARAEVERLRGNPDQEIESLEEARKLGDRSPLIVRQLVEALRRQGKADKAKAVFASMTREELLRGNLAQPAAQVLLLSRDPERARELALAAVREDSRDYRDHLWLGELLAQAARTAEEKKKAEYH